MGVLGAGAGEGTGVAVAAGRGGAAGFAAPVVVDGGAATGSLVNSGNVKSNGCSRVASWRFDSRADPTIGNAPLLIGASSVLPSFERRSG